MSKILIEGKVEITDQFNLIPTKDVSILQQEFPDETFPENSWYLDFLFEDDTGNFDVGDIQEGDSLILYTGSLESNTISSFKILKMKVRNLSLKVFRGVIRYDYENNDNDNPDLLNLATLIGATGVLSRPSSNLKLLSTVSHTGQFVPDTFVEPITNFNLSKIDKSLGDVLSSIGLDSNGDYFPQGSSSSTSISDDIKELFQTLSNNSGNSNVTVSATAPESPSEGDLWYDSEDLSLKIFYGNTTDSTGDDVWVEISSTDSFVVQDGGGSVDLSGYVTQSQLDSAGYLTSSDLSGYATNTELSLQGSHLIHVDKYKSGNYIPDGSINKPYNTIQAAYDSTVEVSGVSTILIGPGDYVENLNISNNSQKTINFIGLGGSQSNTVAILGNVKIDGPQIKIQMKDIRIEGSDENQPALHVNGCRNSSFQNMTIKYGDSAASTATENVLKVTSIPNDEDIQDGVVDFLSCSIFPQGNGILVDGPNGRQVRFYRCNYGANITMPSTNNDTVYLYQCASFGNITHVSGVIAVDQSQITGFSSTANNPLKFLPDSPNYQLYLQKYTLVNFVQITNSSLRLLSGGWGTIEKYGDSNYLIGNNDSNSNQWPPLQSLNGDSLGEVEFQKALDSDPNADIGIGDYIGQSYLRHASEIHYSNKNNPWGQILNESIPYDVESALESLKNDLVDIHDNLYRDGDILVKSGVRESFLSTLNNVNIDFPHDCDNGHIINMETPQTNTHLKLTNLGLSVAEATTITVVIEQRTTNAYIPNQLDIENVSQSIKWQGGSVPSGTVNGVDVISFSILRKSAESYLVLGQLVDFS